MLAYKQLAKQILSNCILVSFLFILTALTSMSFFFVRFTIDGNIGRIDEIIAKGGDELRYRTAITSNTTLAYLCFFFMTVLTAFVIFMFFFRFFRSGRRQMGCLKALGFRDLHLQLFFTGFTAVVSFVGGVAGLLLAYPLSDILLRANEETYGVTGLVKSLHMGSILFGIFVSASIFSFTAAISYFFIKGKEAGSLLAGNIDKEDNSKLLYIADKISAKLPIKNKFSARIALRRPLSLFMIIAAVLSFSICMILAYSLNLSSGKILTSQTEGHNYEYYVQYEHLLENLPDEEFQSDSSYGMLGIPGEISIKGGKTVIKQKLVGIYESNSLYELKGGSRLKGKNTLLEAPVPGEAIIGPVLYEVYGIRTGNVIRLSVGDKTTDVKVTAIAFNAQSDTIYLNGEELAKLAEVPEGSVNELFCFELPKEEGGITVSAQERVKLLEQDAVSNKVSGVINQVTGAVIGCILLFLALYISFQDNRRDILILHLLGYQAREIRKMMIDIYRPFVWASFFLMLAPSLYVVKSIQKNLSVTTGDYMPFGMNIFVIIFVFLLLTLIYQSVQLVFEKTIQRAVRKEEMED